ncbi:MAG TPA: hypothetical protein VF868_03235 [Bacteroidia bacterium]|jgi:hypothetical protein
MKTRAKQSSISSDVAEAKDHNNCVLIGLPKSGKSSFVAALWHVVESQELESSLVVTSLPQDRTYLQDIRNKWLSCSKLERNKVDSFKNISLVIEDKKTKASVNFSFPDISGEMFDLQFETRKISNELIKLLEGASGLMLFINPDKLKRPLLISAFSGLTGEEAKPAANLKSWVHKEAPTQVVLVDILQMIYPELNKEVKIAVIVSAWDTILNSMEADYNSLSPKGWILKEMPLLEQYLDSNSDLFNVKYYGVSAQGGDYTSQTDALHEKSLPSERIIVQEDENRSNDITAPIRWLINE